jgi:inosine-uridine nucleoside N-ribohydrolase
VVKFAGIRCIFLIDPVAHYPGADCWRDRQVNRLPTIAAWCAVLLVGCLATVHSQTRAVIIDTDPAMGYLFHDIDDGLMLISALSSPKLEIVGITTTFGNTGITAATDKAREILDTVGRRDVPVVAGVSGPGEPAHENAAARFIAEQVIARPGEITVLSAGPMTNLAAALSLDPAVAQSIAAVVAVGGLIESSDPAQLRAPYDMNFGMDPDAVQTVLDSPAHLTLIHIDLCLDFMTNRREVETLLESAGSLAGYLRSSTRSWRWLKRGRFVLWDVVGLSYLVNPDWYETYDTGVQISMTRGPRPVVTLKAGDDYANRVRVPVTMANESDYWNWLHERLSAAGDAAAGR